MVVAGLLTLAAPGASAAPAAAPAADEPDPITVSITTLTPLAPGPKDTLVLSGTIANSSGNSVPEVTVRLRVGSEPLDGREQVAQVAEGTFERSGVVVDGTRSEPVPDLNPGQSAPFAIAIPTEALGLAQSGVYQLAVEAQSDPGDGDRQRVGITRTFLPWFPIADQTPTTGLVTLWPLTETPAVDSQGVLLTGEIPRSISPGGRLRVLLDAASTHSSVVTWLADPALVETVQAMSTGYRVRDGNTIVVGEGTEEAAQWLTDVRRVAQRADVFALPYACPDDVALARGGQVGDVVRSITTAAPALSAQLQRTVPSTLAWPADGLVDDLTLSALTDAAPRGVLISGEQATSTSDFTPSGTAPLPSASGSGTAVIPDPLLSSLLASAPRSPAEIVQVRQRVLAELAVIGEQLPDSPRTVVMAPPVRWTANSVFIGEILTAVSSVPWARPTTLSTLLGAQPSTVERQLSAYPEQAQRNELPPDYVGAISRAQDSAAVMSDVLNADSTNTTGAIVAATARAGSAAFRTQQRVGAAIIGEAQARVDDTLAGVRIISRGTITLPGDTGVIPLSVSNTLDSPVTVGISLTASPSIRLSAEPVAPVTIAPGATTLIEVSARVSGSEPLPIAIRLTTPDGTPFGEPASVQVGSSAYSRAAAWVVGVAFGLLVLMLIVNAVRRPRRTRRTSPAASEPTGDATMDE